MREATTSLPTKGGPAVLVLLAMLLGSAQAGADNLEIDKADPPRSFRFSRGSDPVKIAVTVRCQVGGAEGEEIAFAVHDQKGRPLMTKPMPIAEVGPGEESVMFRGVVKTLDPDVKSVVVEAVLLRATRSSRRPQRGETWNARLTYKVK